MARTRERKERRKSTARRRAQLHASGFQTTLFKVPEGLNFWTLDSKISEIDIIPYITKVANKDLEIGVGDLHYERTFYCYNKIGVEEKKYVCSSKTFKKKDYIQEYINEKSRDPDADPEYLKSLQPKERQIFLIYDLNEKKKGIQLWDFSFHLFGKSLDSRVENSTEKQGWDLFYFMDEDGMSLRLTSEDNPPYGYKVTAIDFISREEPLPDKIVNHKICLDDLLVEVPYEKLKNIFLMGSSEDGEESSNDNGEVEGEDELDNENKLEYDMNDEKPATAKDFDLSKGDAVVYKGLDYSIFRISKDGTSLTLIDEEGNMEKAISPNEVTATNHDENEPEEKESDPTPDKDEGKEEEWDEGEEWDE